MTTRNEVYAAINSERLYQDMQWDNKSEEGNNPSSWILWMEEYINKARKLATSNSEAEGTRGRDDIMDMIRKVTALGVAAMEHNGAPLRKILSNDGDVLNKLYSPVEDGGTTVQEMAVKQDVSSINITGNVTISAEPLDEEGKVKIEEWLDISDEQRRVYVYPDASILTIEDPMKLKITRKTNEVTGLPMDSHRILSGDDNRANYIAPGWISIFWYSKKNNPFLF